MGGHTFINARALRDSDCSGNELGIEKSGMTTGSKTPKHIVSCFERLNETNTRVFCVLFVLIANFAVIQGLFYYI